MMEKMHNIIKKIIIIVRFFFNLRAFEILAKMFSVVDVEPYRKFERLFGVKNALMRKFLQKSHFWN